MNDATDRLTRYADKLMEDVGVHATRKDVMLFADAFEDGWNISRDETNAVLDILEERRK